MNDDINDINKTRSLKAKRWRIAFFIFGMFAFSALFYWVLWAVALKEMMPSGIWPFLIFIIFQLLLAIISFVSYKVSSKRWNREIAKKLDRIPYLGDTIEDDKKIRKALRTVRIFQICSIVAILFFLPEIYLEYFRQELVPIAVLSRSNMNYLSIIMAALSIYSLWTAYFFPRMLLKSYKKSPLKRNYRPWSSLMIIQAIRVAMSTSVAIFGFVLGLFGVGWQITTLFFAVWVVSLALMFPTRKKWLSKAEEIKHALATDK